MAFLKALKIRIGPVKSTQMITKAMKTVAAAIALAHAASPVSAAPVAAVADPAVVALAGDWVVDLSVKAGEPYTRPMHLDLHADGTVGGLFYQSPIDAGRWKKDRGRVCVSFRTHDERGPYHSAACLADDHVEGQTWAEARTFLFNWNATRAKQGS